MTFPFFQLFHCLSAYLLSFLFSLYWWSNRPITTMVPSLEHLCSPFPPFQRYASLAFLEIFLFFSAQKIRDQVPKYSIHLYDISQSLTHSAWSSLVCYAFLSIFFKTNSDPLVFFMCSIASPCETCYLWIELRGLANVRKLLGNLLPIIFLLLWRRKNIICP